MARPKHFTTEYHRRDAVARWQASGLSQAEFCRREGIKENALSNWKRNELRKLGSAGKPMLRKKKRTRSSGVEFAAVGENPAAVAPPRVATKAAVAQFVPLVAAQANGSAKVARPTGGCDPIAEISLGQLSIKIWTGADAGTLRTLLQALKEYSPC